MKDYEGAWRNKGPSWGMYRQHCRPDELESLDPKLYFLVMKYGSAFDDYWYIWLSKGGHWVRRISIELAADITSMKANKMFEKPRRYEPNEKLVGWLVS